MKIARQAALLLCLSILLVASWLAPLDAPAIRQVDAGLKRALVTFASARTLNGVISVLQGTQAGGVVLTFAPGQLLAPVNDVVKHFANLMLLACVAFGIQKILITISGYWVISLILTATALGWAVFTIRKQRPPSWLSKLLVILLMLRFAIPVVALGSDFISERFLATEYAESQKAIDTTSTQLDDKAVAGGGKWWNPSTWLPDIKGKLEKMRLATEHMVKLMVIFILQTLLIPILLLWSLFALTRTLFEVPRRLLPEPTSP